MNLKCARCGSEKIIPHADLVDQGQASDGELKARVGYSNPKAWLFKGSIYARLKASICGECGYTELFAEHPATLYADYLAGKERNA